MRKKTLLDNGEQQVTIDHVSSERQNKELNVYRLQEKASNAIFILVLLTRSFGPYIKIMPFFVTYSRTSMARTPLEP